MAQATKLKASDKQAICKKLTNVLKKRYKKSPPKTERPILETLMYAVCLENTSEEQADIVYARFASEFHDLNEVRVSSVSELINVFRDVDHAEIKAHQVRNVLRHVFEKSFQFEYEGLRRKTLEQAQKQLSKIRDLSAFIRDTTLHIALGSHLTPVDDAMRDAAVWLGLVEPGVTAEHASEELKSILRKADAPVFLMLLRCLATDPLLRSDFSPKKKPPEEGYDLEESSARLAVLFANAGRKPKKSAGDKPHKATASKKSAGVAKKKPAAAKTGTSKGKKTTKKK